jgi:signal transduction histidine kinase
LLYQGLSLLLGALLAVMLLAFSGARRRLEETRAQAVLLTTVVGTISGCCYRIQGSHMRRIDRNTTGIRWPTDLHDLMIHLDHAHEMALQQALVALTREGTHFALRMPCTWGHVAGMPPLLLDVTGHRVTPAHDHQGSHLADHHGGRASIDLVWVADVSEKSAATEETDRLVRELDRLKVIVQRLPFALWWRGSDMEVIGGNRPAAELEPLSSLARPLAEAVRIAGEEGHKTEIATSPPHPSSTIELHEMALPGNEYLGFAIDRRETDALRAELTRLVTGHREVLETVPTAIAIYGPDTRLMFFNAAFVALWGLDREFLDGEPTLAGVLDALREARTLPEYADYRQFKADQAVLFATVTTTRQELMHLPDGRTIDCKISRHPFGGLIFIYDDVTGSLDLERSYNTLIAVQRETIDNLFEGIAVFGSDGRLTLWNPAFADTWGATPAELEARPHITTLVDRARPLFDPGDGWEGVRQRLILQVTSYAAHAGQLERRDGRMFRVHGVPLPDGNMLMSYQDTTDSYRVQRALEDRYSALEEAATLKSEFVANVSYELRTPLNAIIGFAEILTNQFFGELNERQLGYSRGILDGSHRLLALINDVLDLATIESGRMALDITTIDVHGLLAGILSLTRERTGALQLEIGFDCATDIGTIEGDERRLRQVLFNLISNALKFTPKNGLLSLAARRVGAEIGITVSDSGIGIPYEDQQRIFEKFERGRTRSEQTGPGLGLPLVKSFVELHGGRVELVSEPGEGTAVTCWLPITRPRAADSAIESEAATERA